MFVQQADVVLAFPVKTHAVAVHHLGGQTFAADRRPKRARQIVFRHGNFANDGAQCLQAGDGVPHLRFYLRVHIRQLESLGQNADFQAAHTFPRAAV